MPAGCYWVLNKGPRRGLYPEYNGRGEALNPKPQTSHLGRCMNLPHIFIVSLRFLVEEINKRTPAIKPLSGIQGNQYRPMYLFKQWTQ